MRALNRRAWGASKPAIILALCLLLALPVPAGAADRARWDTRVFARVEAPGFPANVYVHPNGKVYAGTFSNLAGDKAPSIVREWTRDGTLLRSWSVPGQDLTKSHGVQVSTSDAKGRLIVLDKTSGRVLRLNLKSGRFTTYSVIPDLPGGDHPIPNYSTWGPRGVLFVTDYGQPVIWKVPRGGGAPEAWLQSKKLDGAMFGTAGLALSPDRRSLLVMQQTSLGLGELTVPMGKLYRVDLSDKAITKLWESLPMDLPDGFSFAASGRVYIACAGSNQLVVLDPSFQEIERTPSLPLVGTNSSPITFDTPSNMTFAGTSVLIANQSFLGDKTKHAILDVHVGETGAPLFIPKKAGVRR